MKDVRKGENMFWMSSSLIIYYSNGDDKHVLDDVWVDTETCTTHREKIIFHILDDAGAAAAEFKNVFLKR